MAFIAKPKGLEHDRSWADRRRLQGHGVLAGAGTVGWRVELVMEPMHGKD